jgi:hypothetical protein
MRNVALTLVAAAIGGRLLAPSAARAGDITENLTFNLTGFVDISGSNIPPPITTITGSITVTYDPSLTYDNDTTDIVVHSLTGITVGSPLGFTYQGGYFEFGGVQNDANSVFTNTNDLVVAFNVSDPADPTFIPCSTPGYTCGIYTGSNLVDAAGYTQAAYDTAWFYGAKSTVSPTLPPSTVPEPSSLALFGVAVLAYGVKRGVFGIVLRRRARQS